MKPTALSREVLYQTFLQQTLDAFFIYDADTKRILDHNPAFQSLLGHTVEEVRGLTVSDILGEPAARVTTYFDEIIGTGPRTRSERQWRHKDGRLIDVQVSANWLQLDDQRLVFVIARDITERKRAEQRYRELFQEAPVMYVITQNRNGLPMITDCNLEFTKTLGYSHSEVVGRSLTQFFTQTSLLQMKTPDGYTASLPDDVPAQERQLVTRDGRLIQTLYRAAPEIDLNGQIIGTRAMYLDIGETKRAEAELRLGALLNDLTRSAARDLDFQSTVQLLADQMGQLMLADSCYIALWNDERRQVQPVAAFGALRETYPHMTFPPGQRTLTESVMLAGRSLAAEDVLNSPYLHPEVARRFPIRSALGLPLIAGAQKLGAAIIAFNRPHRFSPEEIARAERASGAIALAVAKARLYDELQASHVKLAEAYDATLEGWAVALELRDKETEGHTRRVTDLTVRLASRMNVPEAELVNIRRGALMHDIGKIGIPDGILRKPGALTTEEQLIMQKHPLYAYDMISAIPFLHTAIDIPYCHHEKWDGTGYPRGLQDEAIPLAARMFAVVDVWDALRSDRPYRAGWPAETVMAHIRSLSGSHFDPLVVEVFLGMMQEEGVSG